jgi:hypothetical protein
MLCNIENTIELCLKEAIAEDAERRKAHRKPFFRPATIIGSEEVPGELPAFCRDISRTGIGLMHEAPLTVGSQFCLRIPLLGKNLELECTAKWCSPMGEHGYSSGSDFCCVSKPQSFLLLSAVLGQELNRRANRRYPFFRPVTVDDAESNDRACFCRDISRSGIGLIHRNPIALGCAVVSLPSSAGAGIIATADIRRCVPIGQGWYSSGGPFPLEVIR